MTYNDTFESIGIDIFDKIGCDVSRHKFWLRDDVSENRNVMIHPYNESYHLCEYKEHQVRIILCCLKLAPPSQNYWLQAKSNDPYVGVDASQILRVGQCCGHQAGSLLKISKQGK